MQQGRLEGVQSSGEGGLSTLGRFLTYTAIGASYSAAIVPGLIANMAKENEKAVVAPAAAPAAAGPAAKPAPPPAPAAVDAGGLVLALVIVVGLLIASIYALPIVVGFTQPIGLLIVGFALWEAWKFNARPPRSSSTVRFGSATQERLRPARPAESCLSR